MRKLMVFIWTTIGSSVGWWLGDYAGFMTAFMLSIVGFGVGMWYGRKAAAKYE
ncbi:MAG TPA: hypothetical protein VG916_01140 [Gemmatimonadaceae bacterium]|nr:hypothetical protein [Gemmatimonadaceae bacterium]